MPVFRPYDPIPQYMFAVELDGNDIGMFQECRGMSLEREVVDYKEGGANDLTMQFPGRSKAGRTTLKRYLNYSRPQQLYDWFNEGILTGKVRRVNLSIKVLSRVLLDGQENYMVVQRWDLLNCWPVKYEAPELSAESVQPAAETFEFAWDSLLLSVNQPG